MTAAGSTTSGRRYTGVRRKYRRAKVRYRAFRAGVARSPVLDLTYRITMGVLGTAIVIIGIIALPAPGPGWAIIFLGLGVLAAEFSWPSGSCTGSASATTAGSPGWAARTVSCSCW
ncbi:PGPGW domain-containing protein [Pseudonocardia sp. ICBG601]|uniref:PGPGW domain-containing protein n=1 Tax=Pseudonocardia sp. ICBG601 TaxID=2846759 RepID=UPI001CF6C09B|nr:PGPGW domain-containing protein [Pseudonocardia sp. ICBG601]